MKNSLSVVIITHNSAKFLLDCLSSVSWVDEIIIFDDNSQDETCSLGRKAGALIFKSEKIWQGFGKQRQLAQSCANGDFILALDADERVSCELRKEILLILNNPKSKTVYSFARYNFFLGHLMRYGGWFPDRKIRLYPREYFFNSVNIHESVDIRDAYIHNFKNPLIHLTCVDLIDFQKKQLKYAAMWANDNFYKGTKCNIFIIIIHTYYSFFKTLILQTSFLDGIYGWLLAVINAQYTFNKYIFLWSLKRRK